MKLKLDDPRIAEIERQAGHCDGISCDGDTTDTPCPFRSSNACQFLDTPAGAQARLDAIHKAQCA